LLIASAGFSTWKTPFLVSVYHWQALFATAIQWIYWTFRLPFPAENILHSRSFPVNSRMFSAEYTLPRQEISVAKDGKVYLSNMRKKGEPVLKPIRPWICANLDGITWRWCSA
jgi:hypothetical protein